MNTNLFLVLFCLVLGIIFNRFDGFPKNAHKTLNRFITHVSLPALVLLHTPQLLNTIVFGWDVLIPVSMAWILFGLSVVTFTLIGKRLYWPQSQIGALVFTTGLSNTSFVGIPLLESIVGPEAASVAILVDQSGSFLVLSTVAVFYGAFNTATKVSRGFLLESLKHIVSFPPFLTLLASMGLVATNVKLSDEANVILHRLSDTLVPIALLSVGLQLTFSRSIFLSRGKQILLGLVFKLVLAPAFFVVLYRYLLGSTAFSTRVTILESAMAAMISSAIVAEEFDFDRDIITQMIGISIPLSLVTVYLWDCVLTAIF